MRKKIAALFLISVVVFVFGCKEEKKEIPELPPFPDEQPLPQTPEEKEPVRVTDKQQMDEIQKMSEAIKQQDEGMCRELSENRVQGCIDRINKVRAIRQEDISVCSRIQSSQIKYECEKALR